MDAALPGGGSPRRRAVEARAVAWLAAHRALIDAAGAAPDAVLFARKALAETAFLVGLRARLDFAEVLADAGPDLWQEQGLEVVGEFARLTAAATEARNPPETLGRVPLQAAQNAHRLADLGLIHSRGC